MTAKANTSLTARQVLDRQVTEKQYQQQIIDLAHKCGYLVFHSFYSQRSEYGFPDLTIVADRLIFLEVKTETGKVTLGQREFIHRLRAAGALAMVVRPSMWPQIERMLLSGRYDDIAV